MSNTSVILTSTIESDATLPAPTGSRRPSCHVLIPFFTPFLYGMERAVIETFDVLRPEIEPHFVQSYMVAKRRPPVIEEMSARGFKISLLTDKKDWVKVGKPKSLRQFLQLAQALVLGNVVMLKASLKSDVLYVPGISYAYLSVLAALALRARGRRVLHHFHDLGTSSFGFGMWLWLVTDCIHNTQYSYAVATRALPDIRRKRNFVVPYVMDLHRPAQDDPGATGLLRGKRNIFFVGQISRHKGIDILLESFKPIAESYPDVMLHLVGGCASSFQDELDRAITQPPLAGRVTSWGFRQDGLLLLRHAYLYVHPSPPSRFHESFGRGVVEAMSLEIPAVCFRSGALQEIVIHERTGLVCEESPSSMTAAISRFISDSNFRDECAANARARYMRLYSPEVSRERWRDIFIS